MRKIFFLITAFLLISLLADPISAFNPENKIVIKPSNNIKQGQTAFIEVQSNNILSNPYFVFNGQKIKLYKTNKNNYRGLIGIDALEKPGNYKIELRDDRNFLNDEVALNILPTKFPIQNIVISGSKSSLAATPYELNKIQAAKEAESDFAYWEDNVEPPFNSPVLGCIISTYGVTRYHNGQPTGDYHKGVDIKAPQGRVIRAIAGGKVLIAEQFRLNGGTVAIDHGQGLTSFYLHMSKFHVKPGDIVKQNQVIGEIGSTGFATGPHLHWGLYINGIPINPMSYWIKSVPRC